LRVDHPADPESVELGDLTEAESVTDLIGEA
jgi:hypothetical protein